MISGYQEAFDGRLLTWDAGQDGRSGSVSIPIPQEFSLVHSSRRAGCYDARPLFTRNNFTVRTVAEGGLVDSSTALRLAGFWTLCFF